MLNKGNTGTIFITSLVWRGPWLGIEVGTSRTRSQHSTTRLSRRQLYCSWNWTLNTSRLCNVLVDFRTNYNWKSNYKQYPVPHKYWSPLNYLLWHMSDWYYLPLCTSSGLYYNCVKFHQYQFISLGGVVITRIMEGWFLYTPSKLGVQV